MHKSYGDFEDLLGTFEKLNLEIFKYKNLLFLTGIIYFVGNLKIDKNITSNDVQTFYANHYLKNICDVSEPIPLEDYIEIIKDSKTISIVNNSLNQLRKKRDEK